MPFGVDEIELALVGLGCPPSRGAEMAAQLDKRARQLSAAKGRSHDEAVAHLLKLMAAGWAAQSMAGSGELRSPVTTLPPNPAESTDPERVSQVAAGEARAISH